MRQLINLCKKHPMQKSIVGPALVALVLACSVTQAETNKATVVSAPIHYERQRTTIPRADKQRRYWRDSIHERTVQITDSRASLDVGRADVGNADWPPNVPERHVSATVVQRESASGWLSA